MENQTLYKYRDRASNHTFCAEVLATLTDCAIIGKFGTDNLALAVESHNILIYTCSIHDNIQTEGTH